MYYLGIFFLSKVIIRKYSTRKRIFPICYSNIGRKASTRKFIFERSSNLKLKYISNVIILFSFLISCKNNKDSVTLNDWFNAYRVVNNDVVTFTGRAMKGRLKAATIKVIPLSVDQVKCMTSFRKEI